MKSKNMTMRKGSSQYVAVYCRITSLKNEREEARLNGEDRQIIVEESAKKMPVMAAEKEPADSCPHALL